MRTRKYIDGILNSGRLPEDVTGKLRVLLDKACLLTEAIILTGSWAVQENDLHSDIDLVFVVEDQRRDRTEKLVQKLRPTHRRGERTLIDISFLSDSSMKENLKDQEYFTMWTRLRMGKAICGDFREMCVPPDYSRVIRISGQLIDKFNRCVSNLDSHTHFSGICIDLMSILGTYYYIEKLILLDEIHPQTKREFLRKLLGPSYRTIHDIYYRLQRKLSDGLRLQVRESTDWVYSNEDYDLINSRIASIRDYIVRVYRSLQDQAQL